MMSKVMLTAGKRKLLSSFKFTLVGPVFVSVIRDTVTCFSAILVIFFVTKMTVCQDVIFTDYTALTDCSN